MVHIAVGSGFKKDDNDGKMKVVLSASSETVYLSPRQAKNVALDLLIQSDRLEKEESWDLLKGKI